MYQPACTTCHSRLLKHPQTDVWVCANQCQSETDIPQRVDSTMKTSPTSAIVGAAAAREETATSGTRASSSSDPVHLLSEYMLRGWVLMGETCRSCPTIPLVFNRRERVYLCVRCDHRYTEADETVETHRTAETERATETTSTTFPLVPDAAVSKPAVTAASTSSSSGVADSLATRLLEQLRWTMRLLETSSSIEEKLTLVELLEREWRLYQTLSQSNNPSL